jgi:hypothetical protein
MIAYLIVGMATSYWVARSVSDQAELGPAEALVITFIWPAILAGVIIGKK